MEAVDVIEGEVTLEAEADPLVEGKTKYPNHMKSAS